jgi:S-adenosylmethionine:tRNA ribosyltransferase-isomerase
MSATIDINEYSYDLPQDRIALHPLAERDQSKLLVYRRGEISHQKFSQLPDFLDNNSLLVLNNTRVIPARLLFQKSSGALIEIFLLNPVHPSPLVQVAMTVRGSATWKCTIGNLKRWNSGPLKLTTGGTILTAELVDREAGLVTFTWNENLHFAGVIEAIGKTPLPPYLKREVDASDKTRYQTVYAVNEGAVAAPTAGLHLTDEVFERLSARGITHTTVTLHVGAGTFMPVKAANALDHTMHEEQVVITRQLVDDLLDNKFVVAVGTTSLRVIESLYWYGCKLVADASADFTIQQRDAYGPVKPVALEESLTAVRTKFVGSETITGRTSIYIHPGYTFRVAKGLITNFHQPGSTLMLLVAAFVGADWKKIYSEAIASDYRFLSYGDSSLLLP